MSINALLEIDFSFVTRPAYEAMLASKRRSTWANPPAEVTYSFCPPANGSMHVIRDRWQYSRKKIAERPSQDPISKMLRGRSRILARQALQTWKLLDVQSEENAFPSYHLAKSTTAHSSIRSDLARLTIASYIDAASASMLVLPPTRVPRRSFGDSIRSGSRSG